jgi:hypothetical protein
MNIRMQAMSQQSSMQQPTPTPVHGSKEEMSPSSMSPHHGNNSMGGMGSPHHVAGVKPGTQQQQQQTTQKPPPAVLQVVKQVKFIKLI